MKFLPFTAAAIIFSLASAAQASNRAECYIMTPTDYEVHSWGTWDDDWGSGLLNNLRNKCGQIDGWGFGYNGGKDGEGIASFTIPANSARNCVADATAAASGITGLRCGH